ncbi:hypothetical protein D3C72_1591490 [compost metagenome]
MVCAGTACRRALAASSNWRRVGLSMARIRPGLVQNCPAPRVSEAMKLSAMLLARSARAEGSKITGLMALISAYTGIGSWRLAAICISATPPLREPVKPTALIRGSATRPWPIERPLSNSRLNTPSGRSQSRTACCMARPTSSEVPGCAEWALTITGQPAARAEALSPPATEKARGKLLAPNTATGPSGMLRRRRSTFGSGWRSGCAGSIRQSR